MNPSATLPAPIPASPLMTAQEFLRIHGDDSGVELVKGRVVRCPMPGAQHGEVCGKANYHLTHFTIAHWQDTPAFGGQKVDVDPPSQWLSC